MFLRIGVAPVLNLWYVLIMRSSGFTLLEILIVIIIVGVLASVAMPLYFQQVESSRGVEARNAMGLIRRALEGCYMGTQDYTACTSWDAMGMGDPSTSANSHFTYTVYIAGPCTYTITAMRNALDNATAAGKHISTGIIGGAVFTCGETYYSGMNTQNCGAIGTCLSY